MPVPECPPQTANIFVKLGDVNWPRYWVFLSAALMFWTLIGVLIPPEQYRIVTTIMTAIVSTCGYFIRASKWITERKTVPGPGEQI